MCDKEGEDEDEQENRRGIRKKGDEQDQNFSDWFS